MKEYKLVIFDVDGTLVKPKSGSEFRDGADDWELLPRRADVLASLRQRGVKTAFASNQGGVAFGYMSEQDIVRELFLTADALGVDRDNVYWCCDHPQAKLEQYRRDSPWRKPGPMMLWTAMGFAGVKSHETLMVGDRPEDGKAAVAAGCAFRMAEDYFTPPTDPRHQWVHFQDRGKVWTSCERCGKIGPYPLDPDAGQDEPCSGMMDDLLKMRDIASQTEALKAQLERLR
jgi:D-glycero-D-manno-heptose 1,7-bisphosphate phosphatase